MKKIIFIFLLFAGCRSVIPARELRSSSAPDISRIVLRKGDSVVVFDKDFGWYDKKTGTVEGVTIDTQHVEYHLIDINKIETVRNYSLIPAIFAIGAVIFGAIFLIAKLFLLL